MDGNLGDVLREIIEQAERRIIHEIRSLKLSPSFSGECSLRPGIDKRGAYSSVTISRHGPHDDLRNSAALQCNSPHASTLETSEHDLQACFSIEQSSIVHELTTQSVSLAALEGAIDANVIGKRASIGLRTSQTAVGARMSSADSLPAMRDTIGKSFQELAQRISSPIRRPSLRVPEIIAMPTEDSPPQIIGLEPSQSPALHTMRTLRQHELLAIGESHDSTWARTRSNQPNVGLSKPSWLLLCGDSQLPLYRGNHLLATFRANLNRLIVIGLLAICVIFSLCKFVSLQHDGKINKTSDRSIFAKDAILPTVALGVGCICRLCLLFSISVHEKGCHDSILTEYLTSIHALQLWKAHSRCAMTKLLVCWFCVVLVFSANISGDADFDVAGKVMHIVMFAFITNVFFAFVHSMVRTCLGLYLGIDNFCSKIFGEHSCENAVENWNVLQATLRQVCIKVARTYIVLLTSSLGAMLLPFIFHARLPALLLGAVALLVLLWVSLFIGGVTSMCDRVPAFINMLDFGISFDVKRQYVVDYILNSRAGFYMCDVRVTGDMVAKCTYVGCGLAAAIATRLLSKSQD